MTTIGYANVLAGKENPTSKIRLDEELPVKIEAGPTLLEGNLTVPEGADRIVLFAHGSGSGRLSPRNRYVAKALNDARFATLLLDLLTDDEEEDDFSGHLRFNISFLTGRLLHATDWVARDPDLSRFKMAYFGASTGAAAALKATAERPQAIRAIVSRGGRPDLAREALKKIEVPTLLIVGGNDAAVIELNRSALQMIPAEQKELKIVPGASHLFEEPGALEEVTCLAAEWFSRYLKI